MSVNSGQSTDRRIARTRQAIAQAFASLVNERRYESIKVADIAERANIGRSTFYEHFRDRDELLKHSMHWLLVILADAAVSRADNEKLGLVVSHLWQNRRLGRAILDPRRHMMVRRALTRLISDRLKSREEDRFGQAHAIQLAASQLALLDAWFSGETTATEEDMVQLLRGGRVSGAEPYDLGKPQSSSSQQMPS